MNHSQLAQFGSKLPCVLVHPRCQRSPVASRISAPTRSCSLKPAQERDGRHLSGNTPNQLALAIAVAPLLLPLQAFCQEQASSGDVATVSPEAIRSVKVASVSIHVRGTRSQQLCQQCLLYSLVSSTLAIPVVVFGAVSLIQQAQQANEDKALRLKAIDRHNTFLSQEEDAPEQVLLAHPAASLVLKSKSASSPSASSSQSSTDDPDAAAPAMLDQPERPEPNVPKSPANSSSDHSDKSDSQVPPQTAVLDRPDRPEPDSAAAGSQGSTHNNMTAQQAQPQVSSIMADAQAPARPYSPRSNEQVCIHHLLPGKYVALCFVCDVLHSCCCMYR